MFPLLPGRRESGALRFEQPSLYRPSLPSHRCCLPRSVPSPRGRMHRQRRATPTAPLAAMPARRAPRRRPPADWSSIPEGMRESRPAAGPPGTSDHAGAPPHLTASTRVKTVVNRPQFTLICSSMSSAPKRSAAHTFPAGAVAASGSQRRAAWQAAIRRAPRARTRCAATLPGPALRAASARRCDARSAPPGRRA